MSKRIVLALLSLFAIVANLAEPAFAVAPASGISLVDPRYLAFVRSHPCGLPYAKSTPKPNHIDDSATFAAVRAAARGYVPRPAELGRMVMIVISNPADGNSHAVRAPSVVAQATTVAQATSVPSAAASAAASPGAGDASAGPAANPTSAASTSAPRPPTPSSRTRSSST